MWMLPVPISRRINLGQLPFRADNYHIHYLMRKAGVKATRAALALAAFNCACGQIAILALRGKISYNLVLDVFFAMCAVWYWTTSRRARALGLS